MHDAEQHGNDAKGWLPSFSQNVQTNSAFKIYVGMINRDGEALDGGGFVGIFDGDVALEGIFRSTPESFIGSDDDAEGGDIFGIGELDLDSGEFLKIVPLSLESDVSLLSLGLFVASFSASDDGEIFGAGLFDGQLFSLLLLPL